EASVLQWLISLQDHLIDLRRYEHSSLVDVQGWSEIPRNQPLFETLLVFENYPVDPALVRGADGLIDKIVVEGQVDTPLAILVIPGEELHLRALYNAHRYDRETIRRLLGHLAVLLQAIVADPARAIDELPLLTRAERRLIVEDWNASDAVYS